MKRLIIVCLVIGITINWGLQTRHEYDQQPQQQEIIPEQEQELPEPEPAPEPTPQNPTPLYDIPLEPELQEYIYQKCKDNDVPFDLFLSLIKTESNFNKYLVSDTNDYGLCQINIICLEYLNRVQGTTDLLNPYQNINAGIYFVSKYWRMYHDWNMVLMSYNLGESGANGYFDSGVWSTGYSQRVLSNRGSLVRQ
jgi:soluble lytic murein transglycosylase-like protein